VDEYVREWRARALLLIWSAGFLTLILALLSLQVIRHDHYSHLADDNRQFTVRVPAPRGVIYDRNGLTLAENVYQARITYPRRLAHEGDLVLESLIELLELNRGAVFERIERSPEPDQITLVRRATPRQIAMVEERRTELPQVRSEVEPRRHYPHRQLASHVLGYVGEVRPDELDSDEYELGDVVGRQGIEEFAEVQLRGIAGEKVVEVNAAGHRVGEISAFGEAVVPGVNMYLTVAQPLQARLEELLETRIGAGVMLEIATGDILAAASMPSYDPNELTGGVSPQRMREITEDPRKRLFNRAFRGAYPPGSPFKLITAAAALERNRVSARTRFEPCWGKYRFGNREFGCWDPYGHGSLDLEGAIVQSCDVYFYQLAQRLSVDELAETARRFGFGEPTGIEEIKEHAGLVPTARWYDQRMGARGWSSGVRLNLAIGQGELLVTPLQLARCFAAIGGDGHLYRPQVVLLRQHHQKPEPDRRLVRRVSDPVASAPTLSFLRRSLHNVVHAERGTGELAQVAGFAVSGKTGTAENPFGEDHAWFVAYAPSEAPEVAVALIVENAGHGGSVAAPIVGALLETYFELTRGQVLRTEQSPAEASGR
jgi:penicillin-binding protein 2